MLHWTLILKAIDLTRRYRSSFGLCLAVGSAVVHLSVHSSLRRYTPSWILALGSIWRPKGHQISSLHLRSRHAHFVRSSLAAQ